MIFVQSLLAGLWYARLQLFMIGRFTAFAGMMSLVSLLPISDSVPCVITVSLQALKHVHVYACLHVRTCIYVPVNANS